MEGHEPSLELDLDPMALEAFHAQHGNNGPRHRQQHSQQSANHSLHSVQDHSQSQAQPNAHGEEIFRHSRNFDGLEQLQPQNQHHQNRHHEQPRNEDHYENQGIQMRHMEQGRHLDLHDQVQAHAGDGHEMQHLQMQHSNEGEEYFVGEFAIMTKAEPGADSESNDLVSQDGGAQQMDQEWLEEKRRAVAKASKTARQKKKREMAVLLEENKRLHAERAEFLQKIEDLVAKVQEMREGGDIDTHIENELLKAQLEEYKTFVGALQRMATGIPTNDDTKRRLYKKGADYAISCVLSLLTRSVREKSLWQRGKLPVEIAVKDGKTNLAMWFRYIHDFKPESSNLSPHSGLAPGGKGRGNAVGATGSTGGGVRLQVRVDQLIPGVDPKSLADVYWSLWNDQNVTQQFFQYADSKKNWEKINVEHVISESISREQATRHRCELPSTSATGGPNLEEEPPQLIKVSYTRQNEPDADWVYVSTRAKQDLSQTALHLPMDEVVGASSSSTNSRSPNGKVTKARGGRKRARTDDTKEAEELRCATCHVLARSTTTHHKLMLPPDALEELQATDGANNQHRTINSFYVEGCVVWDAEMSAPGDPPVSRMSVLLSLPETFNQRWLSGSRSIVNEQGEVTLQFCKYVRGFGTLLAEKLLAQRKQTC